MSDAPSDPAAACAVYYDGACPICAREIGLYRRLSEGSPHAPVFEDVAAGAAPPDGVSRAEALARFHVRLGSGEIVSGAAAFIALWRATPRLAWLGRMASVPPAPWLLEGGYRAFLRLRPLWRR